MAWSKRDIDRLQEDGMVAGPRERIASLIKDVEKAGKQLRSDIRKRVQTAPKNLQAVADRMRKGGADVAAQVEKYVHDLRVSLEPARRAKPKRAAAPKRKKAAPRRKAKA
ncbi:MAG: hypothetical protein ABI629_25775 [bacterium]